MRVSKNNTRLKNHAGSSIIGAMDKNTTSEARKRGRPRGINRRSTNLTLPQDVRDFLAKQGNASAYVEALVRCKMDAETIERKRAEMWEGWRQAQAEQGGKPEGE